MPDEPAVDEVSCIGCGHVIRGAEPLDGPARMPQAGAVSVCVYCGEVSLFTGDGFRMRAPSEQERAELDRDPGVLRVRAAQRLFAGNKRRGASRWN